MRLGNSQGYSPPTQPPNLSWKSQIDPRELHHVSQHRAPSSELGKASELGRCGIFPKLDEGICAGSPFWCSPLGAEGQ
eukprot:6475165-Amphidinium_carterae.1